MWHTRRPGARRRGGQDGASAVEFALVSLVLFLVLFGILQYGFFFSDSISTRQGVREAARQAVVGNYTASGCSGNSYAQIKCNTKNRIGALAGTSNTYVKLVLKQRGANPSPATWKKGNALVVCAMVKNNGFLGVLPMPNGGFAISSTEMSIEQDGTPPNGTIGTDGTDTAPSGTNWNWCS